MIAARKISLALLAAASVLVAGCDEQTDDHDPLAPTGPTGRVRFVNAVIDPRVVVPTPTPAPVVDTLLNAMVEGLPLTAGLGFARVAPATLYYPVYTGPRSFAVRRSRDTTVKVADLTLNVAENADYTVISVGSVATTTETFVLTDDNTAPTAGNVKLRVLNLAPNTPAADVYITAPGASIAAIAPTVSALAYKAASPYLTFPSGAFQVRFTTPGTKTVILDVARVPTTGNLAAGTINTIALLDAVNGGTPRRSLVLTDR